jgi:hypothetical protein
VGVVRSGIFGGGSEALNFATPADALEELLATIPSGAAPAAFGGRALRNLAISGAFFALLAGGWVAARSVATRRRAPRLPLN